LDDYKAMNIYKDVSLWQLLNKLWVNKYCQYPSLIDKADGLYSLSREILGNRLTHTLVRGTIGKVFTAGETIKEAKPRVKDFNRKRIGAIVNFSEEHMPGEVPIEEDFDTNCKEICRCIDLAASSPLNSAAVKMTGILSASLLQKMNTAQAALNRSIAEVFNQGEITELPI